MRPPDDDFTVAIGLTTGLSVLAVRGEVDVVTAPTFETALELLVERRPGEVVLDLSALAFMDAAGIGVIAGAAARLRAAGGTLTIRSAPARTRWVLEVSGLGDLLALADLDAAGAPAGVPLAPVLGPEQAPGDGSAGAEAPPLDPDLRTDLVRVGSFRAGTDVVDAALRLVTVLASATIEGAEGVSVSLDRGGRLATVAASDDTVVRMDAHQYETGEGPCLAAATQGHWFHVEALAEERRWPAFIPLAIDEGIASILSTPLITGGRPLGALNIYSGAERAFGARAQELAAHFATQASGILADAGADVTDEQLARRILEALRSRQVIALAQGVVMAREHLDADEADAVLHRSARAAGVPVASHAASVVGTTTAASQGG